LSFLAALSVWKGALRPAWLTGRRLALVSPEGRDRGGSAPAPRRGS